MEPDVVHDETSTRRETQARKQFERFRPFYAPFAQSVGALPTGSNCDVDASRGPEPFSTVTEDTGASGSASGVRYRAVALDSFQRTRVPLVAYPVSRIMRLLWNTIRRRPQKGT